MTYTAEFLINRRRELWNEHGEAEEDFRYRVAAAKEILKSPQLLDDIKKYPEKLIELEFVIVDKKKTVVPFFLNEVQTDFIVKLNEARAEFAAGKRNEMSFLVLKGRQQGFTSLITAYQLAASILNRNFEGFTLADVESNAQTIFENKAKYPHSQLPDSLKPTEKFNNRKELRFSNINSAWAVATATKNVGRSRTINFFHGSEAAFWQVPMGQIQAAMKPAFTPEGCIIIYETTANGFNDFKDMWDSGAYINCFYEWWRTPEYRHSFESAEKEREFDDLMENGREWISERLCWLGEKGLDKQQLYWYYNTYQGLTDKATIKQEYPCTPEEAFLMSGRPVFSIENIVKRISFLRDRKNRFKEGYFSFEWENPETEDRIINSSIKFVESKERNWIRIYEDPKDGDPYVLGGDTKGEGSDFYTGTVVNNITGNRAATLHRNLNISKPYTHQMYCLGMYYNTALVGIEINFNTGVIEEMQRLNYPRQYVRRKFDEYTKKPEPRYGWKTDGVTRPVIIDRYATLISEHIELINDIPTLEEAMTFVYDEKGKPDAISGKHDDLIFSDMIAEQIREQQTRKNAKDIKKIKYTKEMWEDYKNASSEERKRIIEIWGEPS